MTAAARARRRLTVSEFMAMIAPRPDEERWELLEGEAVLMAPQSERHQQIVYNILRSLGPKVEGRGCRVLPGLGVVSDAADDYAPIPDVVVRCGPPLDGGYAPDPIFIAEVLSPSTMSNDRGRKVDFYKSVESLRAFLVVYQDEARVEAWQRDGAEWRFSVLKDPAAALDLPDLAARLSLADIYRDILFAEE